MLFGPHTNWNYKENIISTYSSTHEAHQYIIWQWQRTCAAEENSGHSDSEKASQLQACIQPPIYCKGDGEDSCAETIGALDIEWTPWRTAISIQTIAQYRNSVDACSARYCKCNGYQPGSTISITRYVRRIWHHRCKHSHRHTTQSSWSKGHPIRFRSYVSDRCFAVKVGNSQSADHKLKYGVPQGSVPNWAFSMHGLFCGYRGDSEETWHQIP